MRSEGLAALLAAGFMLFMGQEAAAGAVSHAMPNGMAAVADYRPGQPGKPALLLLHGFLQTHNFPTIHHLAETLNGAGYAVLAPTLTLGIPSRRQSLACEAIHGHTLADDNTEIGSWLDWLAKRGHDAVILVGHSTGSLNLLAFAAGKRPPAVRKLIGISLVEARLELDGKGRRALEADLRKRLAGKDGRLVEHQLSFCRKYRATAAGLLSYLEWSPGRILETARRLDLPQAYIMGDQDDRLGSDWLPRLSASGRRVRIIHGANHFMDGEHEFDLLDAVLAELQPPDPARP